MIDALILGAGPAGAAAAAGLARLGASVAIVGRPRRDTIEGISARTIARLRAAGLHAAAATAAQATPRIAQWAGESAASGEEFLISRERFDRGLVADLDAAGIGLRDAAAGAMTAVAGGWRVDTASGPLEARCVIDARGRRARRSGQRGPLLMAWSELYRPKEALPQGSSVRALDHGWCWIASMPGGRSADPRILVQYIGAPDVPFDRARIPEAVELQLTGAKLIGRAAGRAAVARFSAPSAAPGSVRIGDASLAMDPLSGHGIYEALGSAQAAVAAINSYLHGADWTTVARFIDERAAESWRRSLATAGDFYRRQAAHAGTEFWRATADGYERLAAQAGPRDNGPGRFEWRPVLNGQRIEMRPVWVSPAWPRGIWHVNGRELSPPARFIHEVLR